jgi:hypothetical protein
MRNKLRLGLIVFVMPWLIVVIAPIASQPGLAETKGGCFEIIDKVTDADRDELLLWGRTVRHLSGDKFGTLFQEGNILVMKPTALVPPGLICTGIHCFIEKRQGQNAFGAVVPVWVYGPSLGRS